MCLVVHVDDYAKKAKSQNLLHLLMKNHTCTRMHAEEASALTHVHMQAIEKYTGASKSCLLLFDDELNNIKAVAAAGCARRQA